MPQIVVSREVEAPAGHVWAILTDLERSPQVISAIAEIERVDDGEGFGVGTRWRETRHMFGRGATEVMQVTAVEPGRAYTVEAEGGDGTYRSVMQVEPLGGHRSRLSMSFAHEAGSWLSSALAATVGRVFAGATRRALLRDLDDIATAAERTS